MRSVFNAILFLCSLTLVGCGFVDDDIHKTDAELGMGSGGLSMSGVGRSGGCGCGIGRVGSRHLLSFHGVSRRGTVAQSQVLNLEGSHIYGSVDGDNTGGNENRTPEKQMDPTPVETVAEHAERSRYEAVREFTR